MGEEEIGVGKEILSHCGKCKEPTQHKILTMTKTGKIGKCQCLTCKAKHNYRDPEKVAKRAAAKKAEPTAEELWTAAIATVTGEAIPYAMEKTYAEGDFIEHEKFGKGVVETAENKRINVIFEESAKLLVHNWIRK